MLSPWRSGKRKCLYGKDNSLRGTKLRSRNSWRRRTMKSKESLRHRPFMPLEYVGLRRVSKCSRRPKRNKVHKDQLLVLMPSHQPAEPLPVGPLQEMVKEIELPMKPLARLNTNRLRNRKWLQLVIAKSRRCQIKLIWSLLIEQSRILEHPGS